MKRMSRISFLLALIALLLITASCKGRVERVTPGSESPGGPLRPTQAPQGNTTPEPTLPEKRLVVLEWPQTIREQDSDLIVLTIEMDEGGRLTPTVQGTPGTPVDIPNLYETHNIFALARLDLAGMESFTGEMREPLRPGKPVAFRWSVHAEEAGLYRGVVWLHIEMVPKGGGQAEQQLILARPIEIQAVTVLGLPPVLARWLGGIGLVMSTALGYPFIQRWLEPLLQRRKRAVTRQKSEPGDQSSTKEVEPGRSARN